MFRVLLTAFFAEHIAASALRRPTTEDSQSLPPGALIPRVVTLQKTRSKDTRLVPKSIRAKELDNRLSFDPLARGPLALAQCEARRWKSHG